MKPVCKDPEIGALLHAYELHALTDEETSRFEIHLIACEHCFNLVQGFQKQAALLLSDETVKALLTEANPEEQARPETVPGSLRQYLWPDIPLVFKPALAYLLILILIIPAYLGLKRTPENAIRTIQSIHLTPFRSVEENAFAKKTGLDGLIQFVFSDAVPGAQYDVRIVSEDERIIYHDKAFDRFDAYGTGSLLLPVAGMEPGRYSLVITDPRGEEPSNRETYHFSVN